MCVWGEGWGVGEGENEIYPQPMDTSLKPIDFALRNLNGVVGLTERLNLILKVVTWILHHAYMEGS